MILQFILTSIRGGFGMIMLDFFMSLGIACAVTLYFDRILVKKIPLKWIVISELIIIALSAVFLNWYLYK